jgi:hypothetical protein
MKILPGERKNATLSLGLLSTIATIVLRTIVVVMLVLALSLFVMRCAVAVTIPLYPQDVMMCKHDVVEIADGILTTMHQMDAIKLDSLIRDLIAQDKGDPQPFLDFHHAARVGDRQAAEAALNRMMYDCLAVAQRKRSTRAQL